VADRATELGVTGHKTFYQGLSEALADHAKAVFKLNLPQDDASTLRDHLQAVERSTGVRPPELDVPELPALCRGVWEIFFELHDRRAGNGFGPLPIDEARLLHWQQLHGVRLSPWEIETIFLVDSVWLSLVEEQSKTKQKNQ
jgi:hypothetical protein